MRTFLLIDKSNFGYDRWARSGSFVPFYVASEDWELPTSGLTEGSMAWVGSSASLMVAINDSEWAPVTSVGAYNATSLPLQVTRDIFVSPLTGGSTLTLVDAMAYFIYLGVVPTRFTPRFVAFQVSTLSLVATYEIGLFASTSGPDGSGKTMVKIESTSSGDLLTTAGVKRNSTPFSTPVNAGVHLWAGLRATGTPQPVLYGVGVDMGAGFVQIASASASLTSPGPWVTTVPATSVLFCGPDLRIER